LKDRGYTHETSPSKALDGGSAARAYCEVRNAIARRVVAFALIAALVAQAFRPAVVRGQP
jgi:hypothetical protein